MAQVLRCKGCGEPPDPDDNCPECGLRIPGSAEPMEDRCAALIRNAVTRWTVPRYCTRTKGFGTTHKGTGACKFHLGSTRNHVAAGERVKLERELTQISERLGKPTPMRDPSAELWDLTSEVIEYRKVLREKLDELNGVMWTEDKAGVERGRALLDKFNEAVTLCHKLLVDIERLGLLKRAQELKAETGRLLAGVFAAVLEHHLLNLSDDQLATAKQLVIEQLMPLMPRIEQIEFAELSVNTTELPIIDAEEVTEADEN